MIRRPSLEKFMQHQIKQLLFSVLLILCIDSATAQQKHKNHIKARPVFVSSQLKAFMSETAGANVSFSFPKGFREINAHDDEDFSFDYALELPGDGFEAWFQVKSQKKNWFSYTHNQSSTGGQSNNPDSLYAGTAAAQAINFTGDRISNARNLPYEVLARYHADAGKSYLLTLMDMQETKHYKYALMITLQKFHTGSITAVYFTNNKDPEFFKNVDRVSSCLKFKS